MHDPSSYNTQEKLDDFYNHFEEDIRTCLVILRDIILDHDEAFSETIKYNMPCFTYARKHFCYLWVDKKSMQPYMLMVDGDKLDHPLLEQGGRKRMKILRIEPTADIPLDHIGEILDEGIALRKTK